ncbi:uncharacterized protein B0T15DRAFT_481869 [Chaetomium strumarium]|uniref:Ankyrin repeat protein n=1 Tax=Chaetomium strumarium TaxID=1170767 RepID=A0AAJ0M654_9PEZI|nr:hypothetical protein B0T15DRAFT_481869 [Chaetomium strumarium]
MASKAIPAPPVPLNGLVKYITQHPETPMVELMEPYRKYEAHLRQTFAQDSDNDLLKDPYVNVLPLFTEDTPNIKIRARKLETESKEERARYIMPLPAETRRADGSPAVVQSFKEFQHNFNVFSESSLVELDWNNVVAAGSSVVNTLLPVPEEYSRSKRGLREFYHEKFCAASDVDLFLYGLSEDQAIEKIKEIENRVRDALLTETTVVRTKHAITICSQYPTRHIQIVLRIYKSVSEILTGFDIDCSGAAYDGKQVYCTPRALQSYMTQINHIDLTRRSPSYESRLSKYSHRGFEVYWPDLDRTRVDPTIFERSFQRTLGLARLLVLERLPTSSARDQYLDRRREERGRPRINRHHRHLRSLRGNIKEAHEDEVADWLTEEEVSNYHTFTIPYGPRFHAKRIEKLCYTRDLLLNAEWNQPEDRKVYLHRHPAFFGRFEDVVNDCCGCCPIPQTGEEKEIAEEEGKVFVSGRISFIKDDPGRQSIGSFNPVTDDDWTEMAYVGNTARLCQAIVDGDLEHVVDWLAQEGSNPNTRDYTGRTPLHLAAMSSTPDIVRALVDAGARLVSRLADGRTALHLAAARGDVEIVRILLDRSTANEAEYEEKQDRRRREKTAAKTADGGPAVGETASDDDESDGEMVDDAESDDGAQSIATGSFVKVGKKEAEPLDDPLAEDDDDEPDFYDINVLAWDTPCSALHYAIIEGHTEVVITLVQDYGADVLLPVKFLDYQKKPNAALTPLMLALALPVEKAKEMVNTLLKLGATSAQADMNGVTAFHVFVERNAESLLKSLCENDPTGTKTAINHIAFGNYFSFRSALQIAVQKGNLAAVKKLLDSGALPHIDFETWLKCAKQAANMENQLRSFEFNQGHFSSGVEQPLILALKSPRPETALELLERAANPNVVTSTSWYHFSSYSRFTGSTLDLAQRQLEILRDYQRNSAPTPSPPELPEGIDSFLGNFEEGTYQHWVVSENIERVRRSYQLNLRSYEKERAASNSAPGEREKATAIEEAIKTVETVYKALLANGAKTMSEFDPRPKDQWQGSGIPNPHRALVQKTEPYNYTFTFQNVNDVTEARRNAYIKLFNASWKGDLKTIKTLTLTAWDDAKEQAPLKIAVFDSMNNNPFSVAVAHGHYNVARAILEIAHAQYAPEEKPKTRYRMQAEPHSSCSDDGCSECSDDESAHGDDSTPRIYGEIIDDQFTIDNVGQVSMKVNSRTTPLQMASWGFLLQSVISENNMQRLKFLLEVYERWSAQKLDSNEDRPRFYTFPDAEFRLAVELGRVELLGEIIKRTGAGLPLEHMVKHTGVEIKVKPRYYQGLTVYGKKRSDWAAAGREVADKPSGTETSPLLLAASAGRIETVEWFLSDTPLRHYLTFAKSEAAREDARLKHLAQAPGGFDAAISKWLHDQSDLVLHAAVYAPPSREATELVSYLVRTQPTLLEVKAANGVTPLMLACRLGRLDAVKVLIDAGADQTTKDRGRNNLLHAALHYMPHPKKLKPLLDLLDRATLIPMLKERNKLDHSGRTPLHQYCYAVAISGYHEEAANSAIRVIKLLFDISPETAKQALRMLDGTGDTPLHSLLARDADPTIVHAVIDLDESLLCCENAVGRTPADVAHDRYLTDVVKPPQVFTQHDASVLSLIPRQPRDFVKRKPCDEPEEHEAKTTVAKNWRLCVRVMERVGGRRPKRTLVSLNSANFVAERLGQQHMRDRYLFQLQKKNKDEDDNDDDAVTSTDSQDGENGGRLKVDEHITAEKRKRRREDVVTRRYDGGNSAWASPKRKEKEDNNDNQHDSTGSESSDDDEDDLLPQCAKCGRRHYQGRA